MNGIKSLDGKTGCVDCLRPTRLLGSLSLYVLVLFVVLASCFPEDQTPLHIPNADYFQDLSQIKHNQVMGVTELEDTLIIAGNNTLYFTTKDLSLIAATEWLPREEIMTYCHSRNGGSNCNNFIVSVVQNSINNKIVVCGTNALVPTCRYYKDLNTLMANASDFEDEYENSKYFCPTSPNFGNTLTFTDGDLYATTPTDVINTRFAISRANFFEATPNPVLLTEVTNTDSKTFSNPDFLTSYSVGDMLYFFFKENAQECSNCDKVVYSRVAKVCKSDKGGSNLILKGQWTTFQKARLGCSIPGDIDFYFHELQDTFMLEDGDDKIIYGVFTTSENSIPGSAVCAYSLSEIENIFNNGEFLEREDSDSVWEPVPKDQVPEPRPAQCHEDTNNLPGDVLEFAEAHPLMNGIVPTRESKSSLFTITRQDYQLTAITVDEIQGKNGVNYRVLYLGTDAGLVLKVVEYEVDGEKSSHLLEEINMVDSTVSGQVRSLSLADNALMVNVITGVQRLPVQRCAQLTECVCIQDPYCGWNSAAAQCDTYQDGFEQNVENVQDCGITDGNDDDGLSPATISGQTALFNQIVMTSHKDGSSSVVFQLDEDNTINNDHKSTIQPPVVIGNPVLGANTDEECDKFETLAIAGWVVAIVFLVLCGFLFVFKRRRRQPPANNDLEKGVGPQVPTFLPNEKNEQIVKQNNIDAINKKKMVTNHEGKSFVSSNETPNGRPDILNNRTKSTVSLDSSYEKTDYI